MDFLEQDIHSITSAPNETNVGVPNDDTTENDFEKEKPDVTYRAIKTESYPRAVEEVLLTSNKNSVCILDIDGVLIENKLTMYPVVCHLFPNNVAEDVEKSTSALISKLGQDAICVATNRVENVKILWSSDKIVDTIQGLLQRGGFPGVKIFTGLNKQIPNVATKKREMLVDHYVYYIKEKDILGRLRIYYIEDSSFVELDRRVFPKEIARKIQKKVKKELGRDIGVDIIDYVLKA